MRNLRVLLFLAAIAGSVAAQDAPPALREQTFVTAIELMVRVTDDQGRTPRDLTAADFVVLEDGVERRVIAAEYLDSPAEPEPAAPAQPSVERRSWDVVIWVDGTTTSQRSLVDATAKLAARADEITSLGPVTIVWSNPAAEIVLDQSDDAAVVSESLRRLGRRAARDQVASIRMQLLARGDEAPPGKAQLPAWIRSFTRVAVAAAREEVAAIRAARLAALDWLSRMPRRPQRALFLVADGFDLDPADFYLDLILAAGDARAGGVASELRALRQTEENEETARALAADGWTVVAIGGSGSAHFPDSASRSGATRVTGFLGSNPGTRPPALLHQHPREPLLQLADATGGSVLPHAGKLGEAVDDLRNRIRVTYQIARAPDGEPRRIEVAVRRPGLTVVAPGWASSTPPAAAAKGRAIRMLAAGADEEGDFPVSVSVELRGETKAREREGTVSARADLGAVARDAGLPSAHVRITVAVGGGTELPFIAQETFPEESFMTDTVVDWSAPLKVSARQTRVAVVVEDLSTGAWGVGAAALDGSALAGSRPTLARALGIPAEVPGGSNRAAALERAAAEGKGLLELSIAPQCRECIAVARESLARPEAQRALAQFVLLLPEDAPKSGGTIRIVDPSGRLHREMSLSGSVDAETVVDLLRRFGAVSPLLAAGAKLSDSIAMERTFAMAYRRAGALDEARKAYETVRELARARGDRSAEQSAQVFVALIDLEEGNVSSALRRLEAIDAEPASPLNQAEALLGIGQALRASRDEAGATSAFVRAARLAPEGSEVRAAALALAGASRDVVHGAVALTPQNDIESIQPLQLIARGRPPFSGHVEVQALVRRPDIDRVRFSMDGEAASEDASPPFRARLDLGSVPRPREIRASGFDVAGALVAEDVLHLNARHDEFGVKLSTAALAAGFEARIDLTIPLGRQAERVELTLDGKRLETLTRPPWRTTVDRKVRETSVLRVVATLDDGRSAEDAVLLDPRGMAEAIEVHDVQVFATVVDRRGQPVRDLTPDEFTLVENGEPKPIHGFEFLEGGSWTAGLAIDSSGSMDEEMTDVRTAAASFLRKTVENGGKAFVVDFDQAPRLVCPTTSDLVALQRSLEGITAGGSTSLFDAIVFGLLQLQGIDAKRALIVLSDGNDVASRYDHRQVVRVARESGATVYVIVIDETGGASLRVGAPEARTRSDLERLTRETGGRAWYLKSTRGLAEIYEQIDGELRNQYLLTYRTAPAGTSDEWRSIRVEVSRPGVAVRSMAGFVAR